MKSPLKKKPTGLFSSERRQKPSCPRRRAILGLEELLPRIVPSTTDSWLGTTSDNWNTAANWSNGVPTSTSDVYISNTLPQGAQTPHIYAGQMGQQAVCATLTSYNNLLIDTNGALKITGQSPNSVGVAGVNQWSAGTLTDNGVIQIDNQGTRGNSFGWTGGTITGAQSGTNNWGIYVCNGGKFTANQNGN